MFEWVLKGSDGGSRMDNVGRAFQSKEQQSKGLPDKQVGQYGCSRLTASGE